MRYLLIGLFIGSVVYADHVTGSIEAYRMFNSNIPAYLDLSGPNLRYGLIGQLNVPLYKRLVGTTGVVGRATDRYFTQIAGQFGLGYAFTKGLELGAWHESTHSLDHYNKMPYKFWSDNRVYIKYKFGVR